MTNTAGTRAIIYTRVSRDDSGEGRSNERQEADCRSFAGLRGLTVVAVEGDVSVSAYSGKSRPGWTRVLEQVRSGSVDVVLAWKVDRITRTVKELVSIIDLCRTHSVSIVTVDGDLDLSTPQGRAVATILGSIAQMEVERKGERQRSANAQRRAEGEPWKSGWASFGYDLNKVVIEEQAQLIRQAASHVLAGGSLKSVARTWRESGLSTPRSSKGAAGWTHNGVKTILLNPVNAGINTYKGAEIGRGNWEAILDEGTFRQLQALLSNPDRRTYGGNGRRPENLLSGIATCSRCGSSVHAGKSAGRPVYKCSSDQGEHLTTPRFEADKFVLEALTATEIFASRAVLPRSVAHGEDSVLQELAELDRREAAITARFSEGLIQEDAWSAGLQAIAALREAASAHLSEADAEHRTAVVLARAAVTNFLSLSLMEKRRVISAIAAVELHPRDRRRNRPISEQVTVWAKDDHRLSPKIAGDHPDSLVENDRRLRSRDRALIEALGPGVQIGDEE